MQFVFCEGLGWGGMLTGRRRFCRLLCGGSFPLAECGACGRKTQHSPTLISNSSNDTIDKNNHIEQKIMTRKKSGKNPLKVTGKARAPLVAHLAQSLDGCYPTPVSQERFFRWANSREIEAACLRHCVEEHTGLAPCCVDLIPLHLPAPGSDTCHQSGTTDIESRQPVFEATFVSSSSQFETSTSHFPTLT